MENRERNSADGGVELPEEIMQHIQSLMLERDAARTTLLSKSWHGAWCTRPNLIFDQYAFRNRMDEFPIFTKKTMRRYEDLNLKIKIFRLWMEDYPSLAAELILKAIKLGVADLKIEINRSWCVLPDEVLESETLVRLYVSGLIVDLKRRNKVVTCPNLKSLTLLNVTVNGDLFRDLISRCPLIEELMWDQPRRDQRSLFDSRIRLEEFDKLEFEKLKYLRLSGLDDNDDYRMDVKAALYRHDLSPRFPCLKFLVIWDYYSANVRICSPSLEHITIRLLHGGIWNGEFDVPNIRTFKMSSSHVPRLKIKTSSREWESVVDIDCSLIEPIDWWFSSLNQLVKMLSLSRVSLRLSVAILSHRYETVYVGDGLPIPAVENLTLDRQSTVTPRFLNSLLRSCRPNFIKIEKRCVFGMVNPSNVEVFPQLQSLPWKTLFDGSKYQQGFVRFQLN